MSSESTAVKTSLRSSERSFRPQTDGVRMLPAHGGSKSPPESTLDTQRLDLHCSVSFVISVVGAFLFGNHRIRKPTAITRRADQTRSDLALIRRLQPSGRCTGLGP